MPTKKLQHPAAKVKPHKWTAESGYCAKCGCRQDELDAIGPCKPEDLSAWCGPGQSVSEMLARAAERD